MVRKKKKSKTVLAGAVVPPPYLVALKLVAEAEDRSVSKWLKKLIEASPQFQEALKQVQAA